MAGMFTMMSMYGYLKARTAGTRLCAVGFFTASGGCALCALATKENSAMLPVSLFFYECFLIRGLAGTDAALSYARQARGASTDAAAPLAIIGEVYRLKGNLKKAVFFWQAYRSERPDSLVAALVLCALYYRTGNVDRLSRVVADLMAARGERAWDVWIEERLARAKLDEAMPCRQDPEFLLSVISFSLKREAESAAKRP